MNNEKTLEEVLSLTDGGESQNDLPSEEIAPCGAAGDDSGELPEEGEQDEEPSVPCGGELAPALAPDGDELAKPASEEPEAAGCAGGCGGA